MISAWAIRALGRIEPINESWVKPTVPIFDSDCHIIAFVSFLVHFLRTDIYFVCLWNQSILEFPAILASSTKIQKPSFITILLFFPYINISKTIYKRIMKIADELCLLFFFTPLSSLSFILGAVITSNHRIKRLFLLYAALYLGSPFFKTQKSISSHLLQLIIQTLHEISFEITEEILKLWIIAITKNVTHFHFLNKSYSIF